MTMAHLVILRGAKWNGNLQLHQNPPPSPPHSRLLHLFLSVQLKLIDLIASHFLVVFDVELQIRLGSGLGIHIHVARMK